MLSDARISIGKLLRDGVSPRDIAVVQPRRYIDADAVSVMGKWVDVVTDPDVPCLQIRSRAPHRNPRIDTVWVDDLGRVIE